MALDTKRIVTEWLPEEQYVKQSQPKNQIVIHHTVSGEGVEGDIGWWKSTKERIAVAFLIMRNGTIVQTFESKYWASSLGIKAETLKAKGFKDYANRGLRLEKGNIGIELDSWGGLTYSPNGWKNTGGGIMKHDQIIEYPKPYRGFKAFEKYTPAQLSSLKELIEFLAETYKIPTTYNPDMFEVSIAALGGRAGIWTHTSFRSDKSDCHPQPELIEMLKTLK
jgi:hypothetical protein